MVILICSCPDDSLWDVFQIAVAIIIDGVVEYNVFLLFKSKNDLHSVEAVIQRERKTELHEVRSGRGGMHTSYHTRANYVLEYWLIWYLGGRPAWPKAK